MGKKKNFKSLRPYQTVVVRKPDPPAEKPEEEKDETPATDESVSKTKDGAADAKRSKEPAAAEVLDPKLAKGQALVAKLQDKTEKEVARTIKVGGTLIQRVWFHLIRSL